MQPQRGRKAIEVSAADLQKAIAELEASQPDGQFPNRSSLWASLEDSEWAKTRSPRPLTAQVGMLLAKKFNTTINTPVGQRGRQKGSGPVPGGGRKKKAWPLHIVDAVKNSTPTKFHKIVDRAAKGSLKAAIKLKCLDCTCFQQKEVRLCELTSCSLWTVRPYKDKNVQEVNKRTPIPLNTLVGVLGT